MSNHTEIVIWTNNCVKLYVVLDRFAEGHDRSAAFHMFAAASDDAYGSVNVIVGSVNHLDVDELLNTINAAYFETRSIFPVTVLLRNEYANPEYSHTTYQLKMDGSWKWDLPYCDS